MSSSQPASAANSEIGTPHDRSSSVAAALFGVRVRGMYDKVLCPVHARGSARVDFRGPRAAFKSQKDSDGTTAERKLLGVGRAVFRDFRES